MSVIKKLVARQMSMAVQLLLTMLLSADTEKPCHQKSVNNLYELANRRDGAVKKVALMAEHFREAGGEATGAEGESGSVTTGRFTRGSLAKSVSEAGSRSLSVFDVPALADVQALFEKIDDYRYHPSLPPLSLSALFPLTRLPVTAPIYPHSHSPL